MSKQYLTKDQVQTDLFAFSFSGPDYHKNKLPFLARIAENEKWDNSKSKTSNPLPILNNYIFHTYHRAAQTKAIYFSLDEKKAVFNTGLMTPESEDIYCFFEENTNPRYEQKYYLRAFLKESDRLLLQNFSSKCLPPIVKYHTAASELYFDIEKPIVKNYDHIFNDNYDRFPEVYRQLGKESLQLIFNGLMSKQIKNIRRNHRIVIPQYYSDRITYLMPLHFINDTIAVALEDLGPDYRANTVLTMDMAYNNARLLMKPSSSWLLPE